eukprot:m.254765 g.254765  ORF g.254765 m.254765 type:complete len:54 (+) comp19150_c0_seq4:507-668(+)
MCSEAPVLGLCLVLVDCGWLLLMSRVCLCLVFSVVFFCHKQEFQLNRLQSQWA